MTMYYRGINYYSGPERGTGDSSGPERGTGDSYLKRNTDRKVETMHLAFMPKLTTNRELTAIYCPQPPTTSKLTTCHYVIHPTTKSNTLCTYSTGLTAVGAVDITDERKQPIRNNPTIITVKPADNENKYNDGGKRKLSASANACTQSERGRTREKTSQNLKSRRRNGSNGIDRVKKNRRNVSPTNGNVPLKKRETKGGECKVSSAIDKTPMESSMHSATKKGEGQSARGRTCVESKAANCDGSTKHNRKNDLKKCLDSLNNDMASCEKGKENKTDIKLSTNKTKISLEKVKPMPDSSIKKKRKSKSTQLSDKSSERGHTEKALIALHPPATEIMPLTQYRRFDSQVTNEHKILGEFVSSNTQLLAPKPLNNPKEHGKRTKCERRYTVANSATIIKELKENEQTKLVNAIGVNIGGGDTANVKYNVGQIEETDRDATTAHNEVENTYMNDVITYHDDDDDIIFGWKREFPVREMMVIKPKVLNRQLPSPKFYQSTEPRNVIRYWQMKRVELNMEIELMA